MHTLMRKLPAPAGRRTWSPAARADTGIALLLFLIITCAVLYAAVPADQPRPVPATAPLTVFSSGRALQHIEAIAQKPHPTGSPANAAVRDYLVRELTALGLRPEVQKVTAARYASGELVAGTPENVVARLKGTATGKAFMLAAHYDSVPTGPGASDDGAGVAAMLETARALKAGSPLKNDVIFLFTDGEEAGLLGARAFVDSHPWAKDVGVVLNLEARGHTGAARLFETSDNNGWIIREFAQAAPYPVTNSASVAGYKLSGSDTDLTVFMEAGWAGLNVAYLEGLTHYHAALDTLEALDEGSLQHLGSSALALAHQFGNADLDQPKASDAIYFNLFRFVVHYPQGWAIPLMVCVVLLFCGVVALGFRNKQLTLGGVALGCLALLLSMIAVVLVVFPLWALIRTLHPGDNIWALEYDAYLFWTGFASLTVALTALLYLGLQRRIQVANLQVGALLWWLLSMVLTSIFFPPASYAATWPLLFSSLGLGVLFALGDGPSRRWQRCAALTLSAVPAVLVSAPGVYGVTLIAGLLLPPAVPIFALAIVLLLGLLIPHLDLMMRPNRWVLPGVAAALGLGLLLIGSLTAGFDARHPKPNDIVYALNADTRKAIWASSNEAPDAWTAQFLGPDAQKGPIAEYLPGFSRPWLHREAPPVGLATASLALLDDSTREGIRALRLRITTPPQANLLIVAAEPTTAIVNAAVNGTPVPNNTDGNGDAGMWALNYWNPPPEGIELTLEVAGTEPLTLTTTAGTPGLPTIPDRTHRDRPPDMMAQQPGDRTLVSKSWTLGARP